VSSDGDSKQRPDGLYVSSAGALMNANRKRINDLAIKSRLPSMQQGTLSRGARARADYAELGGTDCG
jgi:hypothetical protein